MAFFRVIIPTYGNEPLLEEAINSVKSQTRFRELADIVVSHDATKRDLNVINTDSVTHIFHESQLYNGGNRNFAMREVHDNSLYTLFLDHDDTIPDKDILVRLHDFIEDHGEPDMIRLSYTKRYMNDGHCITKRLKDKDINEVTMSNKVAPWTKCIRNDKLVEFPENTLFEDVVHHLKECDICNTYANFPYPVVEWRIWDGQTSTKKGPKWESSKFRFISDLIDFVPKKTVVLARRNYRIDTAIKNIVKEYGECT